MPIRQDIPGTASCVAVYRWVIINAKQLLNIHPASGTNQGDNPLHGVWILKFTSRKDFTYTARLSSSQANCCATFGCAYSDGDILETLKILDLNDGMKKRIGWKSKDDVGLNLGSGSSQEAKKVPDNKMEKPSKTPKYDMTLDIPSENQGGARDNNGNYLLRFRIIQYPDGFEGAQQIQEELWWAKKEVPGKEFTVLTDEEVIRLKYDGKIVHADRGKFPS